MEIQNDPTAQGSAAPGEPAQQSQPQNAPGAEARIAELLASQKALEARLAEQANQSTLLMQQMLQQANQPQVQVQDPFAPLEGAFGEDGKAQAAALAAAVKAALGPLQQQLQTVQAQLAGQQASSHFQQLGLNQQEAAQAQNTIRWFAERGIQLDAKQAAAMAAADRFFGQGGPNPAQQARQAQTNFNAGAGTGAVPPGFAPQVQPAAPAQLPDPLKNPAAFEAAYRKQYPNGQPL
jgi:hypothetical protein